MKNIIKNVIALPILMFAVVAGTFGAFVPEASAAISLQSSLDTVRAANYSDCGNNCDNWDDEGSTYATGDGTRPIIAIGIAYKNNSNSTAQNVRVRLTPTSSNGNTTTFTGRVLGDNASQITEQATVTIPSNATIEFTGDVDWYQNGSNNPSDYNVSSNALSNGFTIGNIPAGNHGGVVAHFMITDNTPEPADLDVQTFSPQSSEITEDSALLGGQVNGNGESFDAWFEYATSSNDLSEYGDESDGGTATNDQYFNASSLWLSHYETINNLNSNTTYYYQICADNGDIVECDPQKSFTTEGNVVNQNINIDTLSADDVDENSALLRGEVVSEQDGNVVGWFEWDTNENDVQNGNGSTLTVSGTHDEGDIFDRTLSGLNDDTTYYYRACGEDQSGNDNCSTVEDFDTQSENNNNFDNPDATTEDEEDVDEDSAELNGEIDMNDANDGYVFFVYGQDESQIDDVENDYDTYNDVDNDEEQDDFMNVTADSSFNGSGNFSEDVNNLDEDTTYYFRICVEYEDEDNDDTLECGSVRNFDTEDEGNNNDDNPDATTEDPEDVDENSADLNGEVDMNDFNNGRVFFVYGQDESQIDDVEDDYDSYSDVDVDGDDLRKVSVDSDLDDQDDYTRTVSGLEENEDYYYQICVEYEDEDGDDTLECGNTEQFETDDDFDPGPDTDRPIPGACAATNVGVASATMSARVDGNGNSTSSYFQYGRTTSFGGNTSTSSTGSNTNIVSKFVSGLSANTTYYCRLVSENTDGTSFGDVGTFRTRTLNIITPVPNTPVTIVSSGGVGAPIFLEIDDEQEMAARGQTLPYDVRWENISGRDLDEVVLNVRLPKSVRFVSSTKGRYNKRDHNVTVSIGELEAGEEDDMVIFATVRGGTEGDQLVAEATIAFEDPQSDTRGLLATIEYDVDTYTNGANGQLAGLFGIGFLPGIIGLLLAILLILIIVLVARRVTEPRHTEYRG